MKYVCGSCGRLTVTSGSRPPSECTCGKLEWEVSEAKQTQPAPLLEPAKTRYEICKACEFCENGTHCGIIRNPEAYKDRFPQLAGKQPKPGVLFHPNGLPNKHAACWIGKFGKHVDSASLLSGPYFTTKRLIADSQQFALQTLIHAEIGAVAGIPRSGLLAANAIALALGVPLLSLTDQGLVSLGMGHRSRNLKTIGRILVVDDSVNSGRAIQHAKNILGANPDVVFGGVYVHPERRKLVDYCYRELPLPHFFEWHLWGCNELMQGYSMAIDFDGILCPDFSAEDDDDGDRYLSRMRTMPCILRPHPYPIPAIVTGRLEKYRAETEAWLYRHGIRFNQLIMGPWESKEARNHVGNWKASVVKQHGFRLFVESDKRQAIIIAKEAGVPVICPEMEKCIHTP